MPFDASLYFPQWQGSPNPEGIRRGSGFLHQSLRSTLSFRTIPVERESSETQRYIREYPALINNTANAIAELKKTGPRSVFTLGGDCSIDVPVVDYLHGLYPNTLGVVWIDAHADVNIPEESPSQCFHGMPVRTLLGEGDDAMLGLLSHPLRPSQLCYAGIRSIDPPEQKYIEEHDFPVLTAMDINQRHYQKFSDWMAGNNIRQLHIHFDLDALDPAAGIDVTYRIPEGIQLQAMHEFLTHLHRYGITVGFTLTEYAALTENREATDKIASLMSAVLPLDEILAA